MHQAPTKLSRKEYVSSMVQRQRNTPAVTMDVPTKFIREEYVSNTVQSKIGGYAVIKVAPM